MQIKTFAPAIPLSYSDELYNLRLHIDLVRGKLKKGLADRV